MKYCLDLYSGLGGFSEAFHQSEDWSVLRIDNNILLSEVPNTMIADIHQLDIHNKYGLEASQSIDVILAGPPCLEFSNAYSAPKIEAMKKGQDYYPHEGMAHVRRIEQIIDIIQPQYFAIENVLGSIPYISEIFGHYRQIEGPHVLWGNFPSFYLDNMNYKPKSWKACGQDKLSVQKRGLIPFEISQALMYAIEQQKSILEWL
jgi:hypothetical protein